MTGDRHPFAEGETLHTYAERMVREWGFEGSIRAIKPRVDLMETTKLGDKVPQYVPGYQTMRIRVRAVPSRGAAAMTGETAVHEDLKALLTQFPLPQHIRCHSHTLAWARETWAWGNEQRMGRLTDGALLSLTQVRVVSDDAVPSGVLRATYADGAERDVIVYGDHTAFSLALRALGREFVASLRLDALVGWLNRKLTRGEPQP